MKTSDKVSLVLLTLFLILMTIFILKDTPIQKAAQEHIRQGDLTVYYYD